MSLGLAYTRKQRRDWKQFKKDFNKCYPSWCEEQKRMDIYLKYKAKVDKINLDYCKGKSSYSAQIYEWHDLTFEEISKTKLGIE